jgi:hypothetical protein
MRQKDLCRLRLVAAANINQIMIWYFNSVFEEDPVVIKEMPIRGQSSQHHSYLMSFLKCCMIHCCGKEQMSGYLQVLKCNQPLMFHGLEKTRR